MSVHKKLMEARIKLQSTKIKKSGWNDYSKYGYFELSDFIHHVQRIFAEVGLCGVVSYETELAKLTITDTAEPSQQIVITSPMSDANLKGCHPVQNLGAVETYQRRYLWMTALEIMDHDAIEKDTNPTVETVSGQKKQLTPDDNGRWDQAKLAFKRDGNLVAVLKKMDMTKEHQEQLMAECENAVV